MESWNSMNRFIFYGKNAELASSKLENQELGLLCLHLLQASLVYVNTLMIQQVLRRSGVVQKDEESSLIASSPFLTQHIDFYRHFELDTRPESL
jgi:TnpA family transposase